MEKSFKLCGIQIRKAIQYSIYNLSEACVPPLGVRGPLYSFVAKKKAVL